MLKQLITLKTPWIYQFLQFHKVWCRCVDCIRCRRLREDGQFICFPAFKILQIWVIHGVNLKRVRKFLKGSLFSTLSTSWNCHIVFQRNYLYTFLTILKLREINAFSALYAETKKKCSSCPKLIFGRCKDMCVKNLYCKPCANVYNDT